jgi:hypothetical protein
MADKQPPSGIPTIYAEQPYYFGADTFANDLYLQDLEEAMQDREQNYASNVSIGGLYGLAGPGSGQKLAELEAAEKRNKLFKGISADGGFNQSEIDAITALINSGAVTIDDVAIQFDLPPAVLAAAYEANKPLGGSQDVYDAIVEASAAIDTAGEYADELNRLNSDIAWNTQKGFEYAREARNGVDALGNELTPAQKVAAERAASAAFDQKNTLVDERNTLLESGIEAGIIQTPGVLERLKDAGLEGVGDVLGAGTRGIYNVASNIPVVGGYLGDSVEAVADFFKNTKGSATINPIIGAVSGIWGEVPEWLKSGTTPTIGTIANTNVGITTGNAQLDAIIGIITGDQELGGETTGAAVGVDQTVIDAAKEAGVTLEDLINAGTAKSTFTDAEIAAEKEKNLAVATQIFEDAGGGAEGVQAVLDTLEENDLTIEDLSDLTGVSESDITTFIDLTTGPTPTPTPTIIEPTPTPTIIEPTPTPTIIEPTPTPTIIEPTPTPTIIEPTPTPTIIEPTPTPTIIEPTPTPTPEPPTPEPPTPELPEEDLYGLFGLRTKPGEKVGALDFYDIGGESIFQDRNNSEEEEDPLAFLYSNLGDSGIVQDYDIEELIRFLESQRG